eukprot:5573267-Prymnesium_polylepis.1
MADDVARGRCRAIRSPAVPMMRPGPETDATRALRCLWHEIRVDERTRHRPQVRRVTHTHTHTNR